MSTIKTWQERIVGDNRTWAVEAGMKAEIAELRAALAASGGNAAPEIASDTLPELPNDPKGTCEIVVGHEMIRGMKADVMDYVDGYSADQMREYGQACHAVGRGAAVREYIENGTFKEASAPNAALVAALEALEEVGALEDGLLGDDPKTLKAQKMARAALSAAGQEVKS